MQLNATTSPTPAPYVPKAYAVISSARNATMSIAAAAHDTSIAFPTARQLSALSNATREAMAGADLAMSIDHFDPGLGPRVMNLAAQAVYVLATAERSADRATFADSLDFAASKLTQAITAMDEADVVRPLPYDATGCSQQQ